MTKTRIEEAIGLKMSDWMEPWHRPGDPNMIMEVLTPEAK